jgi:hypothetical protein
VATITAWNAVALADDVPDERRSAADDTNNPLPPQTVLNFKPSYTFPNGSSRYKAELQVEPILRYDGCFIPDLRVGDIDSIARVQVSAESLENRKESASGLTDLSFVDLAYRGLGPFAAGLGYATVFPMATSDALGQGKWQLGPAVAARVEVTGWLRVAGLVEAQWSVAGSSQSPELAYVSVQPFITVHLGSEAFLSSSAPMKFYWRGARSTLPVNLGLERAFSHRFVGQLQGWYTLADAGRGDVEIRLSLSFLS